MNDSKNAFNSGNRSGQAETSVPSSSLPTAETDQSQQHHAVSLPLPDVKQHHEVRQTAPVLFEAPLQHPQTTPGVPPLQTMQQSSFTTSATGASSAASATSYVVEEEITTVKVPMWRPRPILMKVLHLAGGIGETFTLDEIFNHVKDYIRERVLYDEQNPRIVHCGKDLLGAALEVDTFTVHDAKNLLRKNCTMEPDSCIRVYRHLVTRPINHQPHVTAASGAASYTTAAQSAKLATSTATSASLSSHHHMAAQQCTPEISKYRMTETVSTQPGRQHIACHLSTGPASFQRKLNSSQEFSSSLSSPASSFSSSEPSSSSSSAASLQAAQSYITVTRLDLEENSKRKQKTSADSSSDSGKHSDCWEEHQWPEKSESGRRRRSTSINMTYDEPDGAAGPWISQAMMDTSPGEMAKPEADIVTVEFDSDAFSGEYEVDSSTDTEAGEIKLTENSSDESSSSLATAVLIVCAESDVEYLADYSDSDSGTDAELADADKWECEHCKKKNPPFHRNCGGCWSLRPDWLPSTMQDVQVGAFSQQRDTSSQFPHSNTSDDAQPESQQTSKDSLQSSLEQKCGILDLNHSSAAREAKINRKRKCSSSLSTSDSQEGKISNKMGGVQQANAGISGECKTFDKMKSVSLPLSKEESCVVCLTRRKTASIVHGKTGHQACCYHCATRLKRRRKPCPICRRPIQKVIRNFHV